MNKCLYTVENVINSLGFAANPQEFWLLQHWQWSSSFPVPLRHSWQDMVYMLNSSKAATFV